MLRVAMRLLLLAALFSPDTALAQFGGGDGPLPNCGPIHCPCYHGDDYQQFVTEGKIGFRNAKGAVAVAARFDETLGFCEGFAPVKENGRWGMIDHHGNWQENPAWAYLSQYHEGYATARLNADDELRILDRNKTFEMPGRFAGLREFHEGLCGASKDGKTWGFIDFRGDWAIEAKYEDVGHFSEGFAWFKQNGKYGYLTHRGEVAIEAKYDSAGPFSAGSASVAVGKDAQEITKYGDAAAQELVQLKSRATGKLYPPHCRIYPRLISFVQNGKAGFKEIGSRKIVVAAQFDDAGLFAEGLAPVQIDGKWGFINASGEIQVEPRFALLRSLSGGLAIASEKPKGPYGYVDRTGKFRIPPRFSHTKDVFEGYAGVSEDGKSFGYVDHNGKWSAMPQFDNTGHFSEGLGHFRKNGKTGYVSADGNVLIEPALKSTFEFAGGRVYEKSDRSTVQPIIFDRFGKELPKIAPPARQ